MCGTSNPSRPNCPTGCRPSSIFRSQSEKGAVRVSTTRSLLTVSATGSTTRYPLDGHTRRISRESEKLARRPPETKRRTPPFQRRRPREPTPDQGAYQRRPLFSGTGIQPSLVATAAGANDANAGHLLSPTTKRRVTCSWRSARPTPRLGAGPALAAPRVAAVPLATSCAQPSAALCGGPRPREHILSAESGAHVDVAVAFDDLGTA